MVTTETSGSLRSYAKHRSVSPAAVSKAVKAGRLRDSVRSVNGKLVIDFSVADQEWPANRSRLQVEHQKPDTPRTKIPVVEPWQIGVFTTHGLAVFGVTDHESLEYVTPMTAATARLLADKLLKVAAALDAGQSVYDMKLTG